MAKDILKGSPNPGSTNLAPSLSLTPSALPSAKIVNGLADIAGGICALAVSSGSFLNGAACGRVIGIRILKVQGK